MPMWSYIVIWLVIPANEIVSIGCVGQSVMGRTSDLDVTGLRPPVTTRHAMCWSLIAYNKFNLLSWLLLYLCNKVAYIALNIVFMDVDLVITDISDITVIVCMYSFLNRMRHYIMLYKHFHIIWLLFACPSIIIDPVGYQQDQNQHSYHNTNNNHHVVIAVIGFSDHIILLWTRATWGGCCRVAFVNTKLPVITLLYKWYINCLSKWESDSYNLKCVAAVL